MSSFLIIIITAFLFCCSYTHIMSSRTVNYLKSKISLINKTVLVTGATDGIGQHTASALAYNGATVLLHGRSQSRLDETRRKILDIIPSAKLMTYCFDLQSIKGSKQLADAISTNHGNLDILINNAGVFQQTYITTEDGLESTFAINVAATYILMCMLYPLLKKSRQSIMLNVSSVSQYDLGHIELDNLQFEKGGFSSYSSYSLSKLCIAALSHELATRVSSEDVLVMSCDPGTVNTKMLLAGWSMCGIDLKDANDEFLLVSQNYVFDSHKIHSDSTQIAAIGDGVPASSVHGQYFVDCRISKCCSDVYNDQIRGALWQRMEDITGVVLML